MWSHAFGSLVHCIRRAQRSQLMAAVVVVAAAEVEMAAVVVAVVVAEVEESTLEKCSMYAWAARTSRRCLLSTVLL
jgi:hypothetical protein